MKVPVWLVALVCLLVLVAAWLRKASSGGDEQAARAHVDAAYQNVAAEIASVTDAAYSGGRWYLTDPKTARLHILDSTGALLRSVGRRGRGPGEFLAPSAIAAADNRVYVAQMNVPDVSVFDSAGRFLHVLHAEKPCGASGIVTLATGGGELFVLRRCMEMPGGYRLQVERAGGDRLVVWDAIADTVRLRKPGVIPLTVPILAADRQRVVFTNGSTRCLRVFRRADGREEAGRCLDEIPRVALAAAERSSLQKSFRNRVEVPDTLPLANRILLLDARLIVQTFTGSESLNWVELPLTPVSGKAGRVLGRPNTRESYMSAASQLVVTDDVEGIHIEIVRVTR